MIYQRRSLAPSQVNKRPLSETTQFKRVCKKNNIESQNSKEDEKYSGTLSAYVSVQLYYYNIVYV